jgi:hypothetical protein
MLGVQCADDVTAELRQTDHRIVVTATGSPREGEDCGSEVRLSGDALVGASELVDASSGKSIPLEIDPSSGVVGITRVVRIGPDRLEIHGSCAETVTADANVIDSSVVINLAGEAAPGLDCGSSTVVESQKVVGISRVTEEISGRVFEIEQAPPDGSS